MKFYLALIVVLILGYSSSKSQWVLLDEWADSLIKQGTDYIYNVEFNNAENCFKQVITKYPNHPAGYFLDAMVEWWRIAIFRNNEHYDNTFLNKITKVIDVCDKILDTNKTDIGALFFKGGALGYRGRFYVNRQSWFKAANDGYTAFDILIKCQEIAPQNHDIMLGTGIYSYFADVLPQQYPALKPLMLFAPKGDKKLGIFQLEAAAKLARYASVEAKVVLLQIYQDFEINSEKSRLVAEELHNKYPGNCFFHRYLGRAYVSSGDLVKWEQTWKDVLMRYIDNQLGYDDFTAREAMYYLGYALMTRQKYDLALKYFYKCDEASRKVDKEVTGFMVQTNLKIGKIYDIQKKRDLAIKQYNKILQWKDINNSHKEAQELLKNPYSF